MSGRKPTSFTVPPRPRSATSCASGCSSGPSPAMTNLTEGASAAHERGCPDQVLEPLLLGEPAGREREERISDSQLGPHFRRRPRPPGRARPARRSGWPRPGRADRCPSGCAQSRWNSLTVTIRSHQRAARRSARTYAAVAQPPRLLVEREEVGGVHDRRRPDPSSPRDVPTIPGFDVCVWTIEYRDLARNAVSRIRPPAVPQRPDLPADDVEIDEPEPGLPDQLPEARLGGENVDLEALPA